MKLSCDIQLPASKSESNRALMIAAYGGFAPDFQNLSDSNDTFVLDEALKSMSFQRGLVRGMESAFSTASIIDVADCGTAARFLTTYMACHEGEWLLTGTERMRQRPVKPLVDALLGLNADIQYVEKQGFMPLLIRGKSLSGGKVGIDMSQSSQFVSSLLMAAPMWPQGLELEVLGNLNSIPYLDMTLHMMRHFSAHVEQTGNIIKVWPQPYQPAGFTVSADWSAASYWYELAALTNECTIKLRSLSLSKGRQQLQGDSIIAEWMKPLGVNTLQESDALVLTRSKSSDGPLSFDCFNNPDLFPTLAATCSGLQREARFTGIANLHFKESDRVEAMKTELSKIGVKLLVLSPNEVLLQPAPELPFFDSSQPLQFASHNDHRIVMALAPLASKLGSISFDDPEVVAKSYPDFWGKMGKILPVFGL